MTSKIGTNVQPRIPLPRGGSGGGGVTKVNNGGNKEARGQTINEITVQTGPHNPARKGQIQGRLSDETKWPSDRLDQLLTNLKRGSTTKNDALKQILGS